jgi:hypothetical protein
VAVNCALYGLLKPAGGTELLEMTGCPRRAGTAMRIKTIPKIRLTIIDPILDPPFMVGKPPATDFTLCTSAYIEK